MNFIVPLLVNALMYVKIIHISVLIIGKLIGCFVIIIIFNRINSFFYYRYPFILNATVKGQILQVENMVQMRHELQDAFFRALFIGVNNPYLSLEVRRSEIIQDTLNEVR
jgi:hypothetical protein